MIITKLKINNALGINALELEAKNINVISGAKGTGKTSILDSIKMALGNSCPRTNFVRNDETEATLYVELDNGIEIDRRKRTEKSDYIKVNTDISPEAFLRSLYSEEQFNPLKFLEMTAKEQDKVLLSLVEDNVTQEQMQKWFGNLPDLSILQSQHILAKLDYLGSKQSPWYIERHDIDKQRRYTQETAYDLLSNIEDRFDSERWGNIDLSKEYGEIEKKTIINQNIEKQQIIIEEHERELQAVNERFDNQKLKQEKLRDFEISDSKEKKDKKIEIIKNNIELNNQEIKNLELKLQKLKFENQEHKKEIERIEKTGLQETLEFINEFYQEKFDNIEANRKKEIEKREEIKAAAEKYVQENEIQDITKLKRTALVFEKMKNKVPNYEKAIGYLFRVERLKSEVADLTSKLELARELPGILLAEAKLPISGLKLVGGKILILNSNGSYVTVDGLSEGEKLELCIEIAKAKSGKLKTVLVDGFEKLDSKSQEQFIEKAKESGLQYFITKVDNGELTITEY